MACPSLFLGKIRAGRPVVHCITNFVTASFCARALSALKAVPIMADCDAECAEITSRCSALLLNMGTPNDAKLETMIRSGQRANELGIPVVVDPVGIGVSGYRRSFFRSLSENVRFSVVRGNCSEIYAILAQKAAGRGIDGVNDSKDAPAIARDCAKALNAAVLLSGRSDIVSDGQKCVCLRGGHELMRFTVGTGCVLSALCAVFASVCEGRFFEAAVSASAAWGLCGQRAFVQLSSDEGPAAYECRLTDALWNLGDEELDAAVRSAF